MSLYTRADLAALINGCAVNPAVAQALADHVDQFLLMVEADAQKGDAAFDREHIAQAAATLSVFLFSADAEFLGKAAEERTVFLQMCLVTTSHPGLTPVELATHMLVWRGRQL